MFIFLFSYPILFVFWTFFFLNKSLGTSIYIEPFLL